MSERVDVEADIVEKKGAPEVSTAAMGATACLSCVGCPLMQQCALPQAVEARARAAKRELDGAEEEYVAEIDYAAALLDEDGPAVVWAQAAMPAASEAPPSEEASPVNEYKQSEEAEVVASNSSSWTMALSELWDVSVPESEPEPALVMEAVSGLEESLAEEPEAVRVSELEVEPEPVSEIEPYDRTDINPMAVHQEACATADPVETHAAPVIEVRIESATEVNAEPPLQVIEPPLAIIETAEQVMTDDSPAAPSSKAIYEDSVRLQPKLVDETAPAVRDDVVAVIDKVADCAGGVKLPVIPEVMQQAPEALGIAVERAAPILAHHSVTEIDNPPIVNIIRHEKVIPEVIVVPNTESVAAPDTAIPVETVSLPDGVMTDTAPLVAVENNTQPTPESLVKAPVHEECVPAVVNEKSMVDDEIRFDTEEQPLLVVDKEERGNDEVVFYSIDAAMEGRDDQTRRENYQEIVTNVVYNTTNSTHNTALLGRDSDRVESEAPNAGYGTSWLAAILGIVAVFTVVRRRSSAVY